jgi:hypothetical protein
MSGANGPDIAAVYLSAEFGGLRGVVAGLGEIVAGHDRKLDDLAAGLASLRDAVTH